MFWNESQHFLGSCFPSFSSILIHLIIFCFNIEDFSRCFACLYEAVSDRLSCYLTNLLWYCQEQLLEICCSSETCLLSRTDTHACTHTQKMACVRAWIPFAFVHLSASCVRTQRRHSTLQMCKVTTWLKSCHYQKIR